MKVFEAFSGIGTQRMALKRLGVKFEIVAISEIDNDAIKSYKAIHGEPNNLGDVSKINIDDIPNHDLFTYSFPCQDIANDGKKIGLKGNRSGLLYKCESIIEAKKPKILLLENVKSLVNKNNKEDFDNWLKWLDSQGYDNYWDVLSADSFGIPQIRERVFVVSIRKDLVKHKPFKMPSSITLERNLESFLEKSVDDKYIIDDKTRDLILYRGDSDVVEIDNGTPKIKIKNGTKKGYLLAKHGDGVDLQFLHSKERRGRVQESKIHTLNTQNGYGVVLYNGLEPLTEYSFIIRRLTPLEYWRLMGIDDESFMKAKNSGVKEKNLYKQAGNAIVVDVLYHIFKEIINTYEVDFNE